MMVNSVLPPHNVHQFSWGRGRTPRHPETTSLAFHSRPGHPTRLASACKVRTSWWDAIYNPTYPAGEILAAARCTTMTATLCWLVCTKHCPYMKGAARAVVVFSRSQLTPRINSRKVHLDIISRIQAPFTSPFISLSLSLAWLLCKCIKQPMSPAALLLADRLMHKDRCTK